MMAFLAEDIARTFIRALHEDKDYQQIIYFADNCSAQNKNWYLFSELVMNSDRISAQTITIKLLEAGHTFMSADSIHANVEKRMKIKKEIIHFDDFSQCIGHRNINVLVINLSDFYHLMVQKSDSKVKRAQVHLAAMRSVKFCRNDRALYYKERHSNVEYKKLDFLIQNVNCRWIYYLHVVYHDRGIPTQKKADLIKNLVPLMPANRENFWRIVKGRQFG